MLKKPCFFACAMFLLSSETLAFPTSSANFTDNGKSFEYELVADNGVTGNNEAKNFDEAGKEWVITVKITEDLTFDDELVINTTVKHLSGTTFDLDFILNDDVDYTEGKHVKSIRQRRPHSSPGMPNAYDNVSGLLKYTVTTQSITGFDNFSFYDLILTGEHKDVPEPATLALFSLGMAGLAVRKRFSASRPTL